MDIATIALAIVIGAVAGSVINMIASRLPADGDPSIAGAPLRPGGQPDVLAFVPWLGAWDRQAGKLDLPKLATDVAATAFAVIAFARFDGALDVARAAFFSLTLLLILRIDWQNHLIFSITIVPPIVVAFVLHALDSGNDFAWSLGAALGAAMAFLLLYFLALLLYRRRALGFGDVLLAALIGAMTGREVGSAILLGMFLAAVGGLFLIAVRVRKRTDYIPYGAYLCLGAIAVVLI